MDRKCQNCGKSVHLEDIFCPFCAQKLANEEETDVFSSGEKIKIYLISLLLCPFGLYYFFKYRKNKSADKKSTAVISLVLTLVSIMVLVVVNYFFIQSVQKYINVYESQYELYRGL